MCSATGEGPSHRGGRWGPGSEKDPGARRVGSSNGGPENGSLGADLLAKFYLKKGRN